MKSHHRRVELVFLMIIIILGKKVIMGGPACGRDILAEHGSVGAVRAL